MKRLFLFFFLFCHSLFAEEESLNALDNEPSSFVNNVNVISGTLHHSSIDLSIPGIQALDLQHFYSSDSFFHNWMGNVAMATNFPTQVYYTGLDDLGNPKHLWAESAQGSFFHYKTKTGDTRRRTYYLHPKVIHKGICNTGSGEISARTNCKNNWFHIKDRGDRDEPYKVDLTGGLGDGTFREYHSLKTQGKLFANLQRG